MTAPAIRQVACIGEVMIEIVAGDDGTAHLNVAGDTYNTAVYLAQELEGTGPNTSYVTALGRDRFSDRILADMAARGIGTGCVERRAGRVPGLYAIDTDEEGERHFTYWRSESAARTLFMPPCDVPVQRLSQFDLLYLSGITLAILPVATRTKLFGFLKRFRSSGGRVAFDSNFRPALWKDTGTARDVVGEMWRHTDVALPSLDDEMALFGDGDLRAVARRIRAAGVTDGAIKRGAMGPVDLALRHENATYPVAPSVIDTTAAGDSFNGAFLAATIRGRPTFDAMQAGHSLATRVIGVAGAILPRDPTDAPAT